MMNLSISLFLRKCRISVCFFQWVTIRTENNLGLVRGVGLNVVCISNPNVFIVRRKDDNDCLLQSALLVLTSSDHKSSRCVLRACTTGPVDKKVVVLNLRGNNVRSWETMKAAKRSCFDSPPRAHQLQSAPFNERYVSTMALNPNLTLQR